MYLFLLRSFEALLITVRFIIFFGIILSALPFLSYWNKDITNPYYLQAVAVEKQLSTPYTIAMRSMFPNVAYPVSLDIAKIIILLIIATNLRRINRSLHYYANYVRDKKQLLRWKDEKKIAMTSNVYTELQSKLEQLNVTKDQHESQKLYEEVTQLKRKLESMSRFFAFLSVDVVDSTGMKTSEDRSLIQLDSLRFKKMVQKIFDDNCCVKSAWTPDGAMVCFNTVDSAIAAAQQILAELVNFNKNVKMIKRDFNVRCGIHSGMIYYDEHLPLEEITDQVIDIAGHMQKHAATNTIAISQQSIKPVSNVGGFKRIEKVVDGMQVFIWEKEENQTPSLPSADSTSTAANQ